MPRFLLLVALAALLSACATPEGMTHRPLQIPESEAASLRSESPVFDRQLDGVSFHQGKICLNCLEFGNFWMIEDFLNHRYKTDFRDQLERSLNSSGLFRTKASDRIRLQATLLNLNQKASANEAELRANPISAGAVAQVLLTVRYALIDGDRIVGSWDISSKAASNSTSQVTRVVESTDAAITRNIRLFILQMHSNFNARQSELANREIAAIGGQVDNTRSLMGSIVIGAAKTTSSLTGAIDSTLTAIGQNSGAIAAGLNSAAAQMDRSSRDYNQTYTRAIVGSRGQTVDTSPLASPDPANASNTPVNTGDASQLNGIKCSYYLNENAGVAADPEGTAKMRRGFAASNAKERARGLPECPRATSNGPSSGVSR